MLAGELAAILPRRGKPRKTGVDRFSAAKPIDPHAQPLMGFTALNPSYELVDNQQESITCGSGRVTQRQWLHRGVSLQTSK